nr:MAG TPA: hypothetical protein [Caudoviricetes sp.]
MSSTSCIILSLTFDTNTNDNKVIPIARSTNSLG